MRTRLPVRFLPLLATLIGLATALGFPRTVHAQGTPADYARADQLQARTAGKVFKDRVEPHWFADGDRFWYRNDLADGAHEFLAVDAVSGTRRPAFDAEKLAAALTQTTHRPHDPARLPFDRIVIEEDGAICFEAYDQGWNYHPDTDVLAEAHRPEFPDDSRADRRGRRPGMRQRRDVGSRRTDESPDGRWVAFIKKHNLHLRDREDGTEFALTRDGRDDDAYEPLVFWSPDSSRLVALRTQPGDDRRVYLIESSPRDQVQPKLDSYPYLKPGDRVPISKPHLFDVADHKEIPTSDELFANPWSLTEFRWSPDSRRFTFLFNQRGHQVLRLIAIDAESGAVRALIDERSDTFIDYSSKTFCQILDETDEVLWMSERDGWNHLYLFDGRTGALKNQVTQGEWLVREVDRVDEESRQIWFRALGLHSGQDPYHDHYCRVNFDGTGLVALTEGDGTHEVTFSPDRRYLIDTYSRVDQPPITELRRVEDGQLVCELERADWSALLATGWQVPERFVAPGRDGRTEIHGVIYRPTHFDPEAKYPVIEQIYAGPQGAFVPKGFAPYHSGQGLAELGFVVVQIDGMGTNWRSRAFHDVCWKNLADAGFPDRILWMKAAADKYPYIDLTRVGIIGGSAGGQNALGALLFHGDFYRAAAADCGCHDNRMDKIWWNEQWMGWPVGPHYAEQSNVTNAHRLQGKLLLTVGELDRNVDPASTMQVVDALIRAGKDFELIVFPGAGHGGGGSPYGQRRMRDFFVRDLLGVDPPDRNAAPSTAREDRSE